MPQWAGQCGDCGGWNTLSEGISAAAPASSRFTSYSGDTAGSVTRLSAIKTDAQLRVSVGMAELDRVLGGGLVAGSVVLIGGDPGIGKSTLLLQVLATLSDMQQFSGVRVLRVVEDGIAVACLHDCAILHHDYLVCDVCYYCQVMTDK